MRRDATNVADHPRRVEGTQNEKKSIIVAFDASALAASMVSAQKKKQA
jgi:hypothetical protein